MKQLLLTILLFPSLVFGAFTEFYMQNGGSNLNAGSTTNNTAAYTSTNGGWNSGTGVFTPTDGSTPSSTVSVGNFASVYNDGATAMVYVGRVTAVGAGVNGTITVSTTFQYGTAPSTNASARSIKVGGAWQGPNGAVALPFGLSGTLGALLDTSGDRVRINAKNDQTYSVTASLSMASMGAATLQGYSSSVNDGGRAVFTSNITSGNNFICTSGSGQTFTDIIFASTGGSGSNHTFSASAQGMTFYRCVFHGGRGSGLDWSGGSSILVIESEAYDCNKSNTANLGGFSTSSNTIGVGFVCVNCYSHDHAAGSNAHGYASGSGANGFVLVNSIADTCGGNGVNIFGNTNSIGLLSLNGNYYNNTGDGIKFANTTQSMFSYIVNNNFTKNGGKGINNTLTAQTGVSYNNGRGAGTEANGSADALGSIIDGGTDVTYASNASPYTAGSTGNFSTNLSTAQGVGRGAFTETDGTNTGTVGYPDIGSAQAQVGATFPTPTPTPTTPPETTHAAAY